MHHRPGGGAGAARGAAEGVWNRAFERRRGGWVKGETVFSASVVRSFLHWAQDTPYAFDFSIVQRHAFACTEGEARKDLSEQTVEMHAVVSWQKDRLGIGWIIFRNEGSPCI